MAITTYSELKTAVADWLNRADLTSVIPDFITLAEARFNRDIRVLDMLDRETLTIDADSTTSVAADWLETHSLLLNYSPPINLEYVRYHDLNDVQVTELTGNPAVYSIFNGELFLFPAPAAASTAQHTYYQKIPALSDENTTNWLLTAHPDIYLFGALTEAEPYLKNDERFPVWERRLAAAIESLRLASERAMRPGGNMHSRKRTFG